MSRLSLILLPLLLLGCPEEAEPVRDQPPLMSSWLSVSIAFSGPDSNSEQEGRCLMFAREHGINVSARANLQVGLFLKVDHHHVFVGGAGKSIDEDRPNLNVESLCAEALAMAAELAGLGVTVSKAEPGPGCVARQNVEGDSPKGAAVPSQAGLYSASFLAPAGLVNTHGAGSYEPALADIKLHAAQRHMNYVALDLVREDKGRTFIEGRGFRCSTRPSDNPPSVAEPKAPACLPACSPGYVCVNGKCLSACNPPCQSGFRCGTDRVCHQDREDDY